MVRSSGSAETGGRLQTVVSPAALTASLLSFTPPAHDKQLSKAPGLFCFCFFAGFLLFRTTKASEERHTSLRLYPAFSVFTYSRHFFFFFLPFSFFQSRTIKCDHWVQLS